MELTGAGVVMVAGVLIYALSSNAKVAEVGRIMFFAGLFVVLLRIGGTAFLR